MRLLAPLEAPAKKKEVRPSASWQHQELAAIDQESGYARTKLELGNTANLQVKKTT